MIVIFIFSNYVFLYHSASSRLLDIGSHLSHWELTLIIIMSSAKKTKFQQPGYSSGLTEKGNSIRSPLHWKQKQKKKRKENWIVKLGIIFLSGVLQ